MKPSTRRKAAKLFALGAILAMFGPYAQAAGDHPQRHMTGLVVGQALASRQIDVQDHRPGPVRFRVALSATITLLDGAKGRLEDVLLGDEVTLKLDSETGDIRHLSVISQH